MPWKEVNIMEARLEFVLKSFEKDINFTELSKEYGITPKTGYKWKERFIKDGISGLHDQPRRPLSSPKQLPEEVICEIIRTKQTKLYWGPKKIRMVYARNNPDIKPPSVSTVERILKRAGFIEIRKRRRKISPERIQNRIIPEKPNDVWTVDFKGWWYTSEQERCEPLTVRDEFSKYIFAITILEKGNITSVKREFSRLFKTYGLPRMIKSDNGPPFASVHGVMGLTRLAAWWLSLGIKLHRIDPGSPYQNGAHERMHLDMKKELENKISGSLKLHQAVFEQWRIDFNAERPHESLGMKTPSDVYKKSERKYFDDSDWLVYPDGYINRRVNNRGYINHKGRRVFITNALCGYNVGLKPLDKTKAEVWFEKNLMGKMDLKTFLFKSIMC